MKPKEIATKDTIDHLIDLVEKAFDMDCRESSLAIGEQWTLLRRRLFSCWRAGASWRLAFPNFTTGRFGPTVVAGVPERTVYLLSGQWFGPMQLVHVLAHAAAEDVDHGPGWEAEVLRVVRQLRDEGDDDLAEEVELDLSQQRGTRGGDGEVEFDDGVFEVVPPEPVRRPTRTVHSPKRATSRGGRRG